jgi:hypothetical protein
VRSRPRNALFSEDTPQNGEKPDSFQQSSVNEEGELNDEQLFQRELRELEAYEDLFQDIGLDDDELFSEFEDDGYYNTSMWDESSLDELLGGLSLDEEFPEVSSSPFTADPPLDIQRAGAASLEKALLQGVVPVSAGVGSDLLPGDFGFDPFNFATKDYFQSTQDLLLKLFPERDVGIELEEPKKEERAKEGRGGSRPKALILRDYREAEIRHGRLAMLAAIFWPLQEMLDAFFLDEEQVGPLIYGAMTLPYFPLLMTLIMLLLGYLDIYSQSIKDMDRIGEAFTPGDCFWDPLRVLQGAPDSMKRNMQERELFNSRAAMIAVAAYTIEEVATGKPFISIASNALLLEPAYEIPLVQSWLDNQFTLHDPSFILYQF